MAGPTLDFWQQRFRDRDTPWDRGATHPQLAAWLDAGTLRPGQRVAVPGCGSGHEVAALAQAGIGVIGLDYAPEAVALTRERLQAQGLRADVHEADVLAWQPAEPLDAVYEQTCLCALHPDHWAAYAAQLQRWLRPGGLLCALFMQALRPGAAEGRIDGPPYHCDINAMRSLFTSADWDWPAPPYPSAAHARGWNELGVTLVRRP